MFIKEKGNQIGLYCSMCGKWQKWLSKDEVRVFKENNIPKMRNATKEETQGILDHIEDISKSTGNNFFDDKTIVERIQDFVNFLDKQIDKEIMRESLSIEDTISKCSFATAYERDKNALLNILNGRNWNDNGENK